MSNKELSVFDLLDRLEIMVDNAKTIPLYGRIVLDREESGSLIRRIRDSIPADLQSAKELLNMESQIINDSRRQAEGTLREANATARQTIENAESTARQTIENANAKLFEANNSADLTMKNAADQANAMIADAQARAGAIIADAQAHADLDAPY